jgi:hypothetical protein
MFRSRVDFNIGFVVTLRFRKGTRQASLHCYADCSMRGQIMKTFALIAAAATIALAVPASAQGVSVRIGEPGYHGHQHHHHGYRGSRAHYRGDRDVVVVKKVRPRHHHRHGRTVIIHR